MGPLAPQEPRRDARVLSPLQRELVAIVAEADIHGHFAFAGAGALMALGVIDRPTYDVNFFATRPDEVEEIHPRLIEAMVGRELDVRELHSSPGFRRPCSPGANQGASSTCVVSLNSLGRARC